MSRSRRRTPAVALALTAAAALAATVLLADPASSSPAGVTAAVAAPNAVPAPPAGWSTVFGDDFAGSAGQGVNTSNWIYDTGTGYPGGAGNWGTGEVETMTSSTQNVALDGAGHLAITPRRDGSGHWTSGRIETARNDFQPPAGGKLRIEASIQQPNVSGAAAAGYWPAFWALGGPFRGNYTNWPTVGEIDILEDVNGLSSEFATLHCGPSIPGTCNETTGIGSGQRACSGCQTGFHKYAVEWDRSISPQQLRFYLDGSNFFTIRQDQVDASSWTNATNHGYMVILNVAMGGGFPGAFGGGPTASTQPGVPMLVDYVAVYSSGSGGGTTTPPVTTTPPTGGGTSAYSTIQAESYNGQSGTTTEACGEGGSDVGYIANGDWLQFNNVNFGSTAAHTFTARVASGASGGVSGLVEVRLDSRSNAPVGSFSVANTGGWQTWKSIPGSIGSVTGTHTVYLTFTSGQPADFVNVNWFTFSH